MVARPTLVHVGQSNCSGHGDDAWLIANQPTVRVQPNSRIWNSLTQANEVYVPSVNSNTTIGNITTPLLWGPEARHLEAYQADVGGVVHCFKQAVIGPLGPTYAGFPEWNKLAVQTYTVMEIDKARYEAALAGVGDTASYQGIWITHGESDIVTANRNLYKAALKLFAADLRVTFNDADLPIFINRLHNKYPAQHMAGVAVVRKAQRDMVTELADANIHLADTDALTVKAGDPTHYDSEGQYDLGQLCYATSLLDGGLGVPSRRDSVAQNGAFFSLKHDV